MKGIYQIYNLFNNDNLGIDNDDNVLFFNRNLYFRLYKIESNSNIYFIESKNKRKFLGIDDKDNILIYNKKQNFYDIEKIIWKIIRIKNNFVFIKNIYNNKYLKVNNDKLEFSHVQSFAIENKVHNEKENKKFIFKLVKLYEEVNTTYIKYVNKENIDILIKYIDLSDKKLNRSGIIQIYKDFDNEELKIFFEEHFK